MNSHKLHVALMCIVYIVMTTFADVSVTGLFSSGMVIQRNLKAPIFGKASAGEEVTVKFNGQTKSSKTESNGTWKVVLDPMIEGGPYSLTISGKNTVTLTDVYVGDVWQVAGQSNMDTRLSFYANLADTIKNANVPLLRYCTMRQPGQTMGGQNKWLVVSPSTAPNLSATGYFFGKEIQKNTGVAVGLVVTAVGGTKVTQWMDPVTISENNIPNEDRGGCWNSWVSPVVGFAIKGTVWIQGENNCNTADAPGYGDMFKLIITGWRKAWGQGDFPFIFGQLSGTSGTPGANDVSAVALVREGQRLALELPNTAMTVNCDYAAGDWHYPNKPEAGRRLALAAKALAYGQSSLVYSGPLYSHNIIDGNKIKLIFHHVGEGLTVKGNSLSGFAIAPTSGAYVWATASISGDTVIVSSSSVPSPVRVRYGWANRPQLTLFNKEGLPASPFTTDGKQIPIGFSLTTSVAEGEGVITPKSSNYPFDEIVTVTATGTNGYVFDHWDGDITGTENPVKVTMDKNKVIKAYFVEDSRPQFTVKTQVLGSGEITQTPVGARLAEGTEVSFVAVPTKGWKFVGWQGSSSGTQTEISVSVNKNIDLTAKFMPENISVYEAEDAIIGNGISENTNSGFSGDGYANVNNEVGSSVEIPIYVNPEGSKIVTFTYANGTAASRSFSVSVNGVEVVESLEFESTGNWTTWLQKEIELTFKEGYNTIKVVSNTADGGPNIDKIEIDGQSGVLQRKKMSMKPVVRYNSGKLEIVSGVMSDIRVELFSIDGQKVFDRYVKVSANSKVNVPINKLKSGNYVMRVNADRSCSVGKFLFVR